MFEKHFPSLHWWICSHGWVELGDEDEYSTSWIRIIEEEGIVYEDETSKSLEEALTKAEKWLTKKIEEEFE